MQKKLMSRHYYVLVLILTITSACIGMEKEENPYRNLVTCYRDTTLPEFLDEHAICNLMLTNKQLLQCIRKKSNIYDTQLSIEIPHNLLYESTGIPYKNSDIQTMLIDKESIIPSLSGDYAIAIANLPSDIPWHKYINYLIKYSYNKNHKLVCLEKIGSIPRNKYCRNTQKNALLVELQRENPFFRYTLILNTGTITSLPEFDESNYKRSEISYDQNKQTFHIKRRSDPKYLSTNPEGSDWETYITPSHITHNRYSTSTILKEQIGLANFDFIPTFQAYLCNYATKKCLENSLNKDANFTIQTFNYCLEKPFQYTDKYNETAISSIIDFCNSPFVHYDSGYKYTKPYDSKFIKQQGWNSQKIANIMLALYQSGDIIFYSKLRNELVDITFCPIPSNANLEINALGNKRTKKNSILAFFQKDPYIYDQNNQSFPDEAYEAIVPLESIKHLSFNEKENVKEENKNNYLLPLYTSSKGLVQYICNMAKNKAEAYNKH